MVTQFDNEPPGREEQGGADSELTARARVVLRIMYGISAALPLSGMIALASTNRLAWAIVGPIGIAAIGGAIWLERSLRRRHVPGPILLFMVLLLMLATPEVGMRLLNFRYETGIVFDTGNSSRFYSLVADEGLFWTLPPGTSGVNQLGFRTRQIPPLLTGRSPEPIRVLFLGDSVTFQGYPERAEVFLRRSGINRKIEIINLSLPGYSSHQGLRLIQLHGERIPADLVLIAYGWNDHWLANGVPDHLKQAVVADGPAHKALEVLLRRSRFAQGARYVAAKLRSNTEDREELRVPSERFRANLEEIGITWQQRNAVPILITLPSLHREKGVPDKLLKDGYGKSHQSVIDLHSEYVEIIRSVSRDHSWGLIDLAQEIAELSPSERDPLFLTDGIHLTEPGLRWIGKRVTETILLSLSNAAATEDDL